VKRRPRLTIRARLTLLNTGLFAACGAIMVAVSYLLVAQLSATGQGGSPSAADLDRFVAQCRAGPQRAHSNPTLLAKCNAALQQLGAERQRDLTLSHLLEYSLITVAVVIVLAAAVSWILSGRALRPVHRITAAARAASERNLAARVGLHGPRDELTELADTFDAMLARLQASFESQSRFIANASHELRTPLAVMRATVDVAADSQHTSPEAFRDVSADIRGAVDHAEQLIAALLILARNERGLTVHEEVDLATILEDALDNTNLRGRQLETNLTPSAINGDPILIERLAVNLVDNAVRYNSPDGQIWITTSTTESGAELMVANTGSVIGPADTDRIFEPFQRLNDRASHDGFGLGLAIVASIATIHDGTVTAQPRPKGGLTITVTIPRANPASPEAATPAN
jgi:signal transduction histidine kinase